MSAVETPKEFAKSIAEMSDEELRDYLDALCKQNGFDYAKYIGEYKGCKIYQPSFVSEKTQYFGRPCFLHVSKNKVRRSKNYREAFRVIEHFYGR